MKIKKFIVPKINWLIKRKSGLKDKNLEENSFETLNIIPRYTLVKLRFNKRELIIPDNASFLFMHKEIFEHQIYKFETQNKKPYIIDAGANIGLATIYLKLLYPSAKILAFEPDSQIFRILKKNIKTYNFKGVQLIQKGLWNSNRIISFKSEGADAGIIADLDENIRATDSIVVTSLKPYLRKTVDFLKLDIEGAETLVLEDIKNDLINVERIFVEYHSFVGQPQTLNKIINILTEAKFRIYMSIPGNNSLKSPFMGFGNYNNMDFQLNIFGYKENN